MAKGRSRTTKRKKITKSSRAKPSRSLVRLAFFAIFTLTIATVKSFLRLLAWLIATGWRKSRANPLAALGLCCFFIAFAFIGSNALFQPTHLALKDKKVTQEPKPNLQLITTQSELAEIGLYDGEIDGLSGPKTWAAVENWQKLRQALEKGKRPAREDELARIIREGGE